MPTYEYHCEKCKKNFDVFQSMKDNTFATCPENLCRQRAWGKGKVRRLVGTGAGVIFKGSGFYSTDYRSPKYAESAKKDASGAEPKQETKTETPKTPEKPAPKSAEKD